jgi:hypothetical protein
MSVLAQTGDLQKGPIGGRFEIAQSVILEAGALAKEYFARIGDDSMAMSSCDKEWLELTRCRRDSSLKQQGIT